MVALFLTLDILEISKLGLNLNEYLNLMKLHHDMEGKSFPYIFDERFVDSLIEKEVIEDKITNYSYKLTDKGLKIFTGDEDLFEEFYKTFPSKVPVGNGGFRPVSTGSIDSMSAKTTRAIWDKVTKNKPYLQRKIINSLKKELANKVKTGSLGYLHNIDTWLRQATWEKWEDIPDDKNSLSNSTKL